MLVHLEDYLAKRRFFREIKSMYESLHYKCLCHLHDTSANTPCMFWNFPPQDIEMLTPNQNLIHFIIYSSDLRKGEGIPLLYFKAWVLRKAFVETQDTVSGPQLTLQTSIFTGITPAWQVLKNIVLAFVRTYTEAESVREYLWKVTSCFKGCTHGNKLR